MIHIRRWLTTLLIVALLTAALGFTKYKQVMAAIEFGESFPEPSETVEAIVASASQWTPTIEVVGEVKAVRTAQIRNELEGLITDVRLPNAAVVESGELLMQLDISTELAQLDAVNAQIKLAEFDVKRLSALEKQRVAPQDQLDRAQAQLAISQADARRIQTVIDRKTIRAPFSGTTSIHQFESGTFLPGVIRNIKPPPLLLILPPLCAVIFR